MTNTGQLNKGLFGRDNKKGQVSASGVLAALIILFVIFTVGRVLFNASALDPDSADGGLNVAAPNYPGVNSLMNIGLLTMVGIVLVAAMARIVIGFFS